MDAQTQVILGVVNLLFVAALVGLTAWYAKSTRDLVTATRAVPSVIVDVEFERGWLLTVVVRNVGNAVAKDITISCPPTITNSHGHRLADLGIFQHGISYLAPGREVTHLFDSAYAYYQKPEQDGHWEFEVAYSDLADKRFQPQKIAIDLSVYKDLRFTPGKTLEDVVKKLEDIKRVLDSMVSHIPKGVRIVTSEDVAEAVERIREREEE
jgi:hypothetical protein